MPNISAQVTPNLFNSLKKTAEEFKLPQAEIIRAMIEHFLTLSGKQQHEALQVYIENSRRGKLYKEKRELEQRIKEIEKEINGG